MNKTVKKIALSFFILLCIGAIGYGGYMIYLNISTAPPKVSTTQPTASEADSVLQMQIATLADSDFTLYTEEGTLFLRHKGNATKFDWTGEFTSSTVQMHYADYNNDTQKELAIVITKKNADETTTNELHLLSVQENGKSVTYRDTTFSANSFKWASNTEFVSTQMPNQKRVSLQFNNSLQYFRVPAKADATYYTFEKLDFGNCIFKLEGDTILVTVDMVATFQNYAQKPVVGSIGAKLMHNGEQYIYSELAFTGAKEWGILKPVQGVPTPFTLRADNGDEKVSTGMNISELSITLERGAMTNRNFDTGISDERYLSSIVVTQNSIAVFIPTTMQFHAGVLENHPVTVWLGGDDGYYIQKATTITAEAGSYCMRTEFDEPINESDFSKIVYHFGS